MKRVGIITILDNVNYGNRLQNLAMQRLLEELGCRAETIRHSHSARIALKDRLLRLPPVFRLNRLGKALLGEGTEQSLLRARQEEVLRFNRRLIRMSRREILDGRAPAALREDYHWFVTGSDQVWNPHFARSAAPDPQVAYLRFAPPEKRIAISPSFGVAQLPPEAAETAARYLRDFRFLSVRERDGQALIKALTGLDCPVLPDPTLLADPALWEELLRRQPPVRQGGFVLTYFLGRVSPRRRRLVEGYAAGLGLPVVWMNDAACPEAFAWGPERFLRAVRDCSALFTDSFHGCVFSLLFHRQFFPLGREDAGADMSGRIASLLEMVGLEDRTCGDGGALPAPLSDGDFTRVDGVLAARRAEARTLLEHALEGRS